MANTLEFALGLQVNQFLSGLGMSTGKLLSFEAAMSSVGKVMQGVWGAIERGGALKDLSIRTGASVGDLYQLQEAFAMVGIGAESAGPMILRMQKALAGVDDSGNKTGKVFDKLGLGMNALKGMNAPKQFQAIAAAMSKLGKEDAAGIASKLFGREGAGNMLQLMRDMDGFQQSIKGSASAAEIFARSAEAFDNIGDTITSIKGKIGGLFAGLAERAAPEIQAILDLVDGVDWVGIGQYISSMFIGIIKVFQGGRLFELISETFLAAFDTIPSLAVPALQKLGALLLRIFEEPLNYLQAGLEKIVQEEMQAIGDIPGIGKLTGLSGFKAQSWDEIMAAQRESGPRFFSESLGLKEINDFADEALKEALKGAFSKAKAKLVDIGDFLVDLGNVNFKPGKGKKAKGGWVYPNDKSDGMESLSKSEGTSLEKLGFVMGGMANPSEYTKRTADNTSRMAADMAEIRSRLERDNTPINQPA